MSEFHYDAFISYSHRDMKWGRWLQRRLEAYRIPRDFRGDRAAGQSLRVFRDQTDLAGLELQDTLQKELRLSKALIVICSPASAASKWVNEEVRYFQTLEPERPIIPFIVEGEPDSDSAELECYPPAIRSAGERFHLGANVQEIGKTKAFLKTVSLLLDVRFNRLVDREKQRRLRNGLISGAVLLAAGTAAALLLWNNVKITRENRELSYDIYWAGVVSEVKNDTISPEGFSQLLISAEAGNDEAMLYLADCCKKGLGTEADPEAAFGWYMKAAEAGNADGMIAVASCLTDGTGTQQDLEQAFAWSLRAAEKGNAAGMVNTAAFCEDGIGTAQDAEQALQWYRRAADAGNELGMYNLSRCYRDGIGTAADPAQAFAWILRLAELGQADCMYNVGLMYQYGYGTQADPRQAYLWYRKAAEAGDADGMYMVGWCTETRYGTEDAALEWYLKSAALGNADAQDAAARLTEAGSTE